MSVLSVIGARAPPPPPVAGQDTKSRESIAVAIVESTVLVGCNVVMCVLAREIELSLSDGAYNDSDCVTALPPATAHCPSSLLLLHDTSLTTVLLSG